VGVTKTKPVIRSVDNCHRKSIWQKKRGGGWDGLKWDVEGRRRIQNVRVNAMELGYQVEGDKDDW